MTEKMKPSGIAWIGNIPSSWNVSRVKYHYDIMLGKMLQPIQENSADTYENYMCSANVTWTGIDLTVLKQMWFSPVEKRQYRLQKGDLIVAEGGDVAVSSIWNEELEECYLQNALHRVRHCQMNDNRFLYYWLYFLKHSGYIELICNKATIAHFTKEKFGAIPLCVMDNEEQKAISDYLDARCAQIDSVIADIEKQIETLKKYKKSLITEAVTKGLDRSVPMQDSGIEWIGKIPAHWGTNRLRYVASVKTGPFGTQLSADEYVDEGIPIINVKNIGYGSILAEDLDFVPETVADRLSVHRLKIDDIVFGRKGAVDKHAIITDEYADWVQGSDCIRVRSNPEIDSEYLNYLFDSTYFGSYVMLYAVGATMPSMSSDILLNARILVPPVQEQKDIAAHLNNQCGKINDIIANKKEQLAAIRSHKKSMIYEYVTGKKRVTEVS